MDKKKKLYETFCTYIETCKKLNTVLWDSIASSDLLEPDQKYKHFIKNFELTDEFKNLIKELENWDSQKPDTEDEVFEYGDYYHKLQSCLGQFFINIGIYDRIILEKEFNKDKAFNIFLNELEKKEIEGLKYGEVFPLKIEMRKGHILEFEDFILSADLNKYGYEEKTKFAFIIKYSIIPFGFDKIGIEEIGISFSDYLLMLNLYFDKPVYLRGIYQRESSLFSHLIRPEYWSSEYIKSAETSYNDALQKYMEEKYPNEWYAIFESDKPDWDKWDEWDELKAEKEEEFINTGKAPINYLKEAEIEGFKEFIVRVKEFLRSDLKNNEYLRVALDYFLMAHERPDIARNLVDHVIALESLYCSSSEDIGKQFRIRILNLLCENKKGRGKDNLYEVYDIRSRYVHGDIGIDKLDDEIQKKFKISTEKFYLWLRNVLRLSILSFFSLSKAGISREEIHKILDVGNPNKLSDLQMKASSYLLSARPSSFGIEDYKDFHAI